MIANRFKPLTVPFVILVVAAALGHIPLTIAGAAILVSGVMLVCTDELLGKDGS